MTDEGQEPRHCANCHTIVTNYDNYGSEKESRFLCIVCAATWLSRASYDPDKELTQGEIWIMKSIAQLFNYLFEKLDIDQSDLGG